MKKKFVTFMAAAIVTVGVAATTFAGDTFHEFFSGTARISKGNGECTNTFTSKNETHTVRIHPYKIYKEGQVFAYRIKKGLIFDKITKKYSCTITSCKYYTSEESGELSDKYYYTLETRDRDNSKYSSADVVFNQAYVRESK